MINDGHSRRVYHPQCIAVMHLVQGNTLVGLVRSAVLILYYKPIAIIVLIIIEDAFTSLKIRLQVFVMICKNQYRAEPTTGSRSMIVWAESVQRSGAFHFNPLPTFPLLSKWPPHDKCCYVTTTTTQNLGQKQLKRLKSPDDSTMLRLKPVYSQNLQKKKRPMGTP